jgi:hypothetical protein
MPAFVPATSASLSLTTSEPAGLECMLDGGAWRTCADPLVLEGLREGLHVASARATDVAGNVGPPSVRSWTADVTAPKTTITGGPPAVTTSTSAHIAFKTSEPGTSAQCQLDGGAWASCRSIRSYGYLRLGAHNVRVRATDRAGNVESVAAAYAWKVVAP